MKTEREHFTGLRIHIHGMVTKRSEALFHRKCRITMYNVHSHGQNEEEHENNKPFHDKRKQT